MPKGKAMVGSRASSMEMRMVYVMETCLVYQLEPQKEMQWVYVKVKVMVLLLVCPWVMLKVMHWVQNTYHMLLYNLL